jgi:hypothetical protein
MMKIIITVSSNSRNLMWSRKTVEAQFIVVAHREKV